MKILTKIMYGYELYTTQWKLIIRKKILEKKNAKTVNSYAHVSAYCVPNAGDIVLSQTVRDIIDTQRNESSWFLVDLYKSVNPDTIKIINKCKALVMGGGGLFLPDSNKNSISGWQWAISKEFYDDINVPIIIYAVGYNYFKGQKREKLFYFIITALIEKASFVGLRSRGSVEIVREFLPENLKNKICYQPCPTMIANRLYRRKHGKETKTIAFNVALDRPERRYGTKHDFILNSIAQSMKHIEQMGYNVIFVAHCIQDLKFTDYLKKNQIKCKIYNLINYRTEDIYEFYRNVDAVYGMRSHSIWIPFGVECVILPFIDQNKNKWFMKDIRCEELGIDIMSQNLADNIINHFKKYIVNEYSLTQKRLSEAQDKLYEICLSNLYVIKNLINNQ